MEKFIKRGYSVKETAPILLTSDVDKTFEWFNSVLGWYGTVDEKDAAGNAIYACVYSIPYEIEKEHIAPFTGIHLLKGKATTGQFAMSQVNNIENLYSFINKTKQQVTPLNIEPWGAKTFEVTIPGGAIIKFFENLR